MSGISCSRLIASERSPHRALVKCRRGFALQVRQSASGRLPPRRPRIHPGPPEGSTVSRRQTEPPKAARRPQSRRSIHLEQGFEATRLNTGTMTDLATLAAHLLANFRTVRIPASGRQEGHADWWTMVKARGAANRAAYAYRDRLCQELVEHGCRRFLDRMECDPAGGWRLHIFPVDDAALALLDRLTEGAFGPGDAVSFNARRFVSERIHLIANDTNSS